MTYNPNAGLAKIREQSQQRYTLHYQQRYTLHYYRSYSGIGPYVEGELPNMTEEGYMLVVKDAIGEAITSLRKLGFDRFETKIHGSDEPFKPVDVGEPAKESFIVLLTDRHTDIDVEIFDNVDMAIKYAQDMAHLYHNEKYPEDWKEKRYDEDHELGWIVSFRYSCEGDRTLVMKRTANKPRIPFLPLG